MFDLDFDSGGFEAKGIRVCNDINAVVRARITHACSISHGLQEASNKILEIVCVDS